MTLADFIRSILTLDKKLYCVNKWLQTYMRLTCSLGELNKWLSLDLHQLKQFCAENGLETLRAKSFEICLMPIYLQPNA